MAAIQSFVLTNARLLADCKIQTVGDNYAVNISVVDDSVQRQKVDESTGEIMVVKPWQEIQGTLWFPKKGEETPKIAEYLTKGRSVNLFCSDVECETYENKDKKMVKYLKCRIDKIALGEDTKEAMKNRLRNEIIHEYEEAKTANQKTTKVAPEYAAKPTPKKDAPKTTEVEATTEAIDDLPFD